MNNICEEPIIKLPYYVYDKEQIIANCQALGQAFPRFDMLYSIKTNPFAPVVETIAGKGYGADAASVREVEIALESGIAPADIYFSAPGKTREDLTTVQGKCVIIADSFHEVELLQELGQPVKIGLRINPDFSMDGDCGFSSKFGIDVEQLEQVDFEKTYPNVTVVGLHIHLRSQILDHRVLGSYYEKCINLAKQQSFPLEFFNFGSGIGTVYNPAQEQPLQLESLSNFLDPLTEKLPSQVRLLLETGRYLVCNTGTYYTEIVDIKTSRGIKYLIVKNAMNGFFRPAQAALLHHNVGETVPNQEPLYTCNHAFSIHVCNQSTEMEQVHIVGNLCTALDVLAENITVKKANIGDMVSVSNAGSYAYSLSPLHFSSHPLPGQYLK